MARKTTILHFAAEPKMKAALLEEAKTFGLPLSFIIRKAIQHYLKSKEEAAA